MAQITKEDLEHLTSDKIPIIDKKIYAELVDKIIEDRKEWKKKSRGLISGKNYNM